MCWAAQFTSPFLVDHMDPQISGRPPEEGGGNLEQLQQNLAAAAESRWAAIGCGRL
jgi:hypothetical protein